MLCDECLHRTGELVDDCDYCSETDSCKFNGHCNGKHEHVFADSWKVELYDSMLGYLVEAISDDNELIRTLRKIGFTDEQLISEDLITKESTGENS